MKPIKIQTPYLLFLGDAPDALAAKVAQGIKHWRAESCVGQLRLPGCNADVGLTDMSIADGRAAGAKTLVVGVANRGGVIADNWIAVLREALENGMDVAAGLHNKLADVAELREAADANGQQLFDVRHPTDAFAVASGKPRAGKRLLAVGTDCSCGKMYTTLAIEKEMRARGMAVDFRATGQTGILIAGSGVSIDAVIADFISGAVEAITPANDPGHWDIVEGQGSLFHASFAGVSTGLLHGAQADALVLCHEPTRTHMRGLPDYPVPELEVCIEANIDVAKLTNSNVMVVGVAINTAALSERDAQQCLDDTAQRLGLPTVDPFRNGVAPIVDALA